MHGCVFFKRWPTSWSIISYPTANSEGSTDNDERKIGSALRTKHRITRDVMIGGVEDLRRENQHPEVVRWAEQFGVVYRHDSAVHSEWLALCTTWDAWQLGCVAVPVPSS